MAQGGGTSFLKVFLGVLAGVLVAGSCLAGGCLVLCGRVAQDLNERQQAQARYASSIEAGVGSLTFERDYAHVRGYVKNNGNKTVRYWKLQAHFLGESGAVVDTGFTMSVDRLAPGQSKNFEIMQRRDPRVKSVRVEVQEVQVE